MYEEGDHLTVSVDRISNSGYGIVNDSKIDGMVRVKNISEPAEEVSVEITNTSGYITYAQCLDERLRVAPFTEGDIISVNIDYVSQNGNAIVELDENTHINIEDVTQVGEATVKIISITPDVIMSRRVFIIEDARQCDLTPIIDAPNNTSFQIEDNHQYAHTILASRLLNLDKIHFARKVVDDISSIHGHFNEVPEVYLEYPERITDKDTWRALIKEGANKQNKIFKHLMAEYLLYLIQHPPEEMEKEELILLCLGAIELFENMDVSARKATVVNAHLDALQREHSASVSATTLDIKESENRTTGDPRNVKFEPDRGYVTTQRSRRQSEFETAVKDAYNESCAVCGNRRYSPSGSPEVDAAHIHPVADGGLDTIGNGIALCKFHHWSFDVGWWGISDTYSIMVLDLENREAPKDVSKYIDQRIKLPQEESKRPNKTFLMYHRKRHSFEPFEAGDVIPLKISKQGVDGQPTATTSETDIQVLEGEIGSVELIEIRELRTDGDYVVGRVVD